MSFGYALKRFRDERGLSLREFGKLCEIDHAYIHRLEKDEKTAPSDDVVESFVRNLKLNRRRAHLLRLLVGKTMNEQLIEVFILDKDRPLELIGPLAEMSFRGKRPETLDEWQKKADQLMTILEDLEG